MMSAHIRLFATATTIAVLTACGNSGDTTSSSGGTKAVASVALSPSGTLTLDALQVSQAVTATATASDGTPATTTLTWQSDATAIATVSGSGSSATVTSVGNGTAHITAKASNNVVSPALTVVVSQVASQLTRVSGNAQTATVNTPLPLPLVVSAADRNNNPVAGASVTFTGTGGTFGTVPVLTGANGQASVTWTLPTVANTYTATAALVSTPSATAAFSATAAAGAAARLVKLDGDAQRGTVSAALTNPIIASVVDQFGNGVGGASVVLAVTAGGGTLNGTLTTTTAVTSGVGQAPATWTLGSNEALAQTVQATATGLQGSPALFSATALRPSLGGLGPPTFKGGCHLTGTVTGIAVVDQSHVTATFAGVASGPITLTSAGSGTVTISITAPALSLANNSAVALVVRFYSLVAPTQTMTYDTGTSCS